MDSWTSLATNDEEGQAIFETTVKKKILEFTLSFHLSDPMTSMSAPRRWCHYIVEISRKIRKFWTDLLTLLANNNEKGQAIKEQSSK